MLAYLLAAGRRCGRARRIPARGVGLVAAAFLLVSCTRVEIEDHSLQYNEATGSLANRVMLLNVLRAAKGYPVQFSRVSNYTGQSRMDGTLSMTFPFVLNTFGNPSATRLTGSANPQAQFKTGVNSLQLADLNTAEIQEKLRKLVNAREYTYYRSQGWPKALVNTILIESLAVHPDLVRALAEASETICGSSGLSEEQKRGCQWRLMSGTSRECPKQEERTDPDGDRLLVFANSPRKHCEFYRFQRFFASIRALSAVSLDREPHFRPDECGQVWLDPRDPRRKELKELQAKAGARDGKAEKEKTKDGAGDEGKRVSESVKDGKVSVDIAVNLKTSEKGDKDKDDDSGKDQTIYLNIPRQAADGPIRIEKGQPRGESIRKARKRQTQGIGALRNEYVCLLKRRKTPIVVVWRSPERMVRYLGEVVAVQAFGAGSKSGQIQIMNDDNYLVDMFRVERGAHLLAGKAAVSVEGPERESFFVPVPEPHSRSAHLSLQTLALVMEAFNQAVSGKALPPPPTIILPGG